MIKVPYWIDMDNHWHVPLSHGCIKRDCDESVNFSVLFCLTSTELRMCHCSRPWPVHSGHCSTRLSLPFARLFCPWSYHRRMRSPHHYAGRSKILHEIEFGNSKFNPCFLWNGSKKRNIKYFKIMAIFRGCYSLRSEQGIHIFRLSWYVYS